MTITLQQIKDLTSEEKLYALIFVAGTKGAHFGLETGWVGGALKGMRNSSEQTIASDSDLATLLKAIPHIKEQIENETVDTSGDGVEPGESVLSSSASPVAVG